MMTTKQTRPVDYGVGCTIKELITFIFDIRHWHYRRKTKGESFKVTKVDTLLCLRHFAIFIRAWWLRINSKLIGKKKRINRETWKSVTP